MEKATKGKIIFWSIVGLVLLSGTVSLASHFKNKPKGDKKNDGDTDIPPANLGGGTYHDPINTVHSPLNTSAEIKKFQAFANTKGAGLVVDGVWGPKTAAAWVKYSAAYLVQGATTPTTPSRVVPGERAVAIISGGPVYDYSNSGRILQYTNKGISIGYIVSPSGDKFVSVSSEPHGSKKYLVENKFIYSEA